MNVNLTNEIKKAIEDNTLVFFIGSGTSIPLGFPDWNNLIIEILNRLSYDDPDLKDFIPLLSKNRMTAIEVLEKIKNNKKEIYEIMQKRFLVSVEDKKLNIHKKLWQITDKIITTNYDTALESANSKITPTVYTYSFETSQLTKKSEYLLKLHGSIEDANQCILFEEDYKKLYNQDEKSVLFQLKKIMTDSTIIFLGFSLQDPYVCNIFENMNKTFQNFMNKHFIISTNDDDFSKYSTDVLKINNWEDSLEKILNEMIIIKSSKNSITKEGLVIQEKATDLVTKEKSKVKIALLLSSPIDNPYEFSFSDLIKNFAGMDVSIKCYYLSLEVIRELDNYDYFVLFTQVYKNKLCIENEYFKSDFMSLRDLQDNIYCKSLKAVICFTNNDIEIEDVYTLPFIIYKQEKRNIKDIIFKLLRKNDKNYIESNCKCSNLEKTHLIMIPHGNVNVIKSETKIPDAIDTKKLLDFVGRDTDLETITRKIIDLRSNGQVLTIKGSGGLGKTTIVKKCAQEFSKRGLFSQGIYFIDLEHIENYSQFESKVAQCFELDNTMNFKEHIKLNNLDRDSLIIFDNFETLLYVEDYLSIKKLVEFTSDYSTVVLTSREIVFDNSFFEDVYPLRDFTTEEAVELFKKYYPYIEKEDMKILKSDIIENLLNKNPLAIRIVTANLPKGKNIRILKKELEEDFFNTLSEYKDDIYIKECDENIEKSKSLYQSINYSYKKLNDKEKLAFELLSLFPDGINMENFKNFFKSGSKNLSCNQVKDIDIKSLENKSLVDLINGNISLQSIIRRFADYQFNQREKKDKVLFYKEAFNYNSFFISFINNINKKKSRLTAYEMFDSKINNFLKSISYLDKFEDFQISKMNKLDYIDYLGIYSCSTHFSEKLLHEMRHLKDYFDNIQDGELLFNIIKINLFYFLGDFDTSFKELNKIISLNDFKDIREKDELFKSVISYAFNIYFLEGTAFEFCKWIIYNKLNARSGYNSVVFELGKYSKIATFNEEKDFFDFELDFNRGNLNEAELTSYMNSIYSKYHLEKMQIHYLKSKIDKIDKETIDNLVVTNPYTLGLKNIMYAFIESDVKKVIEYYTLALEKLKHIKYYYVECLYYFSRFLKNIHHQDYDKWINTGYTLAKEHYYGFLIYKFECLMGKTTDVYNENNYLLPEELNFNQHIEFLKNIRS